MLISLLIGGPSLAQQQGQAQSGQAAGASGIPGDKQIVALIFASLIALNQANQTGNYSVLREIGSPGFQANSTAQIAEAFADLRKRNLDLSPVLLYQPKLMRKPQIDANGMLRVTGYFSTQPRLDFDLLFEPVGGRWLLFGMAVDTSKTLPQAASPAQAAPAQTAQPVHAAPAKPVPATPKQAAPDVRDKVQQLDAAGAAQ